MNKYWKLMIVVGLCVGSTMPLTAVAQEISEVDVVRIMIESTINSYQSMVKQKLERDGVGSDPNFSSKKGFVPPTATFMRRVAFDAIAKNKRAKEKQFSFTFAPGGEGLLAVKIKYSALTKDQKGLVVAKILDSIVRSIRGIYTATVVRKLKKDGLGASIEYLSQSGYVPLPAVFVRAIFSDITSKQIASGAQQFSLGLRSRWSLNPLQGLQDEFEHDGWENLARQQDSRLASGQSLKNYLWDPYVKTVSEGGKQVLRFLSADPAAGKSCVSCHNQWESKAEIKDIRARQQVEVGKVFKRHELLGVLSIKIEI